MQELHRGDVYYVKPFNVVGHVQRAGRPAVIISNEANNLHSPTVVIVYLTSQPKKGMPTHATVFATGEKNTVICEQIVTVDRSLLGDYMGSLSDFEMKKVDEAIKVSLSLNKSDRKVPYCIRG